MRALMRSREFILFGLNSLLLLNGRPLVVGFDVGENLLPQKLANHFENFKGKSIVVLLRNAHEYLNYLFTEMLQLF